MFAEIELEILSKSHTDPENRPIVVEFIPEILALCEKFGNSGQSGFSTPYVASALTKTIEKLCLKEPISPITGIDEEWNNISDSNEILFQNKRCSGLFKHSDNSVKYIDSIIKKTQNGQCYCGSFWLNKNDYLTGNRDLMINSSQEIKGFPFEPKTFYIDVIEEEVGKDDFEMFVKDINQLKEVFKYYKMPKHLNKYFREEKLKRILNHA